MNQSKPSTPGTALALPATADEEPTLSEAELRARVDTSERAIQTHLDSLVAELAPNSFMLGDRPAVDRVRAHPVVTVLGAIVIGAALSVLLVVPRKRKRPEVVPAWRIALDQVSDKTGLNVLSGRDLPQSLREIVGDRTPVVLVNSSIGAGIAEDEPAPSTFKRAVSAALKTAIGFGAKSAIDLLSEELRASALKSTSRSPVQTDKVQP